MTVGVLVALLGTAAAIAVPNFISANLNANESAAIATLKNISSGQSQCQASGVIDVNGNGSGEYGFFAELAGAVTVRGGSARITPAVLSKTFGELNGSRIHRSGYVFQMFLPDAMGKAVAEDPDGGDVRDDNGVDAPQAETLWCCYAWPRSSGQSGRRAFFVNQCGDVLATNGAARSYEGSARAVQWDAAFAASDSSGMANPVAANTVGHDGNTWVVL